MSMKEGPMLLVVGADEIATLRAGLKKRPGSVQIPQPVQPEASTTPVKTAQRALPKAPVKAAVKAPAKAAVKAPAKAPTTATRKLPPAPPARTDYVELAPPPVPARTVSLPQTTVVAPVATPAPVKVQGGPILPPPPPPPVVKATPKTATSTAASGEKPAFKITGDQFASGKAGLKKVTPKESAPLISTQVTAPVTTTAATTAATTTTTATTPRTSKAVPAQGGNLMAELQRKLNAKNPTHPNTETVPVVVAPVQTPLPAPVKVQSGPGVPPPPPPAPVMKKAPAKAAASTTASVEMPAFKITGEQFALGKAGLKKATTRESAPAIPSAASVAAITPMMDTTKRNSAPLRMQGAAPAAGFNNAELLAKLSARKNTF